MRDADPRHCEIGLALSALGTALNLADSSRTAGARRAAGLFALGGGLPARCSPPAP